MPAEKKPKRPPRTLKERKFAKEYLETSNATEAAARVYDVKDRNSANAIGAENLAKLSFLDIFEQAGFTKEVLMQNAARIAYSARRRDQFSSEFYEDNKVHLDGIKFIAEIADWMPAKKNEVTGKDGGPIQFSKYGIVVYAQGSNDGFSGWIDPKYKVLATAGLGNGWQNVPLPADFDMTKDHKLTIEWADQGRAWTVSVDDSPSVRQAAP